MRKIVINLIRKPVNGIPGTVDPRPFFNVKCCDNTIEALYASGSTISYWTGNGWDFHQLFPNCKVHSDIRVLNCDVANLVTVDEIDIYGFKLIDFPIAITHQENPGKLVLQYDIFGQGCLGFDFENGKLTVEAPEEPGVFRMNLNNDNYYIGSTRLIQGEKVSVRSVQLPEEFYQYAEKIGMTDEQLIGKVYACAPEYLKHGDMSKEAVVARTWDVYKAMQE